MLTLILGLPHISSAIFGDWSNRQSEPGTALILYDHCDDNVHLNASPLTDTLSLRLLSFLTGLHWRHFPRQPL